MDDPNQNSASKTGDYVTISIKTENSIVVKTEDSLTTITVKSQDEDQTPSAQEVTKMICKICTQVYGKMARIPMTLSCGHICCRRCLINMQTPENYFKCAVCRSLNVGSIQNFTLIDYLEEINVLATDDEMTDEDRRVQVRSEVRSATVQDAIEDYDSEDERLTELYGIPMNVDLTPAFLRTHNLVDLGRRMFCELCQRHISRHPQDVARHVNGFRHGTHEQRLRDRLIERQRQAQLAAARRRAQLPGPDQNENDVQIAILNSIRDAQSTDEVTAEVQIPSNNEPSTTEVHENDVQNAIERLTELSIRDAQSTDEVTTEVQDPSTNGTSSNEPSVIEVQPMEESANGGFDGFDAIPAREVQVQSTDEPSVIGVQPIEEFSNGGFDAIPTSYPASIHSQRGGGSAKRVRFAQQNGTGQRIVNENMNSDETDARPVRVIGTSGGRGRNKVTSFWTGRNTVIWTTCGWLGPYDNANNDNANNMPLNWRTMPPDELSTFFEQENNSNSHGSSPKGAGIDSKSQPSNNAITTQSDMVAVTTSAVTAQSNTAPMTISDYKQWRAPFPEYKKSKDGLEFFCFFGKKFAFDNYFIASFVIDGQEYECVQNYLQTLPQETWTQGKEKIVAKALEAKFRQNEFCLSMLIRTDQLTIVEASWNKYWGIGCDMSHCDMSTTKWSGRNRFGQLLMDLRQKIQEARPNNSVTISQTSSTQASNSALTQNNSALTQLNTTQTTQSSESQLSTIEQSEQKPSSTSEQKPKKKLESKKTMSPEDPKKKSKKSNSKSSSNFSPAISTSTQTDNEETKHSVERTSQEATNIEETMSLKECLEELEKENERKLETILKMREELKEIPVINLTE